MKIIENVTIYKCDFCKKELKRKHAMVNHEQSCLNNPKNHKKCLSGCKFLETKEIYIDYETYYDHEFGEQEYKTERKNVFYCSKLDKLMYPYSIERKGLANRFPTTYEEQEAMPKECESFSSTIIMPWDL